MKNMSVTIRVMYAVLSVMLLMLGGFLIYVDEINLPSRYGAEAMGISAPTTWFVSSFPILIGVSIMLYLVDKDKYEPMCKKLVGIGFLLAFVGLVFIGPIMNNM